MFDFESLTLGEVSFIEELSGRSIASLNEEAPQGKFLAALVTVAKRRAGEPQFKFNDALNISLTDANELLGFNEKETEEEGEESASVENETD